MENSIKRFVLLCFHQGLPSSFPFFNATECFVENLLETIFPFSVWVCSFLIEKTDWLSLALVQKHIKMSVGSKCFSLTSLGRIVIYLNHCIFQTFNSS